jgi:hypothetical protein
MQEGFLTGKTGKVVATNAFGMGTPLVASLSGAKTINVCTGRSWAGLVRRSAS